jgi:hypothetical protein
LVPVVSEMRAASTWGTTSLIQRRSPISPLSSTRGCSATRGQLICA